MDNSLSCQVNILRARSCYRASWDENNSVSALRSRKASESSLLSPCSRSSARGMTTDAVAFGSSHRDNSIIESLRTPKMISLPTRALNVLLNKLIADPHGEGRLIVRLLKGDGYAHRKQYAFVIMWMGVAAGCTA